LHCLLKNAKRFTRLTRINCHTDYKIPNSQNRNAEENIDKIVAYCDALMVARGDLVTSCHEVPLVQKELIRR
jgi:pyruvate kinase